MLKKSASFVLASFRVLNGDPAASPTRRRAQAWCSLFVAPCAPEGTPPALHSLRPCWTALFSILRDGSSVVPHEEVKQCQEPFSGVRFTDLLASIFN